MDSMSSYCASYLRELSQKPLQDGSLGELSKWQGVQLLGHVV